MKEMANGFIKVRITKFPKDHPNGYARVEWIDWDHMIVCVSNANMPFMGTFTHKQLPLTSVKFIKGN